MSCVNQIVSLRKFTHFMNVRLLRNFEKNKNIPVLILKNDLIALSYMIDVNLIWETNLTCFNQIVSLRLLTNFSNVRLMRKTNNSNFDFEKLLN
jgi:hypothetical protein